MGAPGTDPKEADMQDAENLPEPTIPDAGLPPTAGPAPVLLQLPVDVRSASLVILATLASIFMPRWARGVFIPVLGGLLCSYALSPVVDWLQARGIPRALSAALLILGLLGGLGVSGYSLSDDANRLVGSLPAAAQKLRLSLHAMRGEPDSTLVTVQKAAAQLEQAAEESNRPAAAGQGVQRVMIERPRFDIKAHLWTGGGGLADLLGRLRVV